MSFVIKLATAEVPWQESEARTQGNDRLPQNFVTILMHSVCLSVL